MSIEDWRKKIDAIDGQILDLLDERAAAATTIGREKRKALKEGKSDAPKYYDPEREKSILSRLGQHPCKVFPPTAIPFVFREIISACRSLETELKVAYLGPSGTYSQIAASQVFGSSIQYLESATIDGVFEAVARNRAEYGVVPVENSYGGGVNDTLDGLAREDLQICGEVVLRINHCLVSRAKSLSSIKKVYSHPQALDQSRAWLAKHLPGAAPVAVSSTAAAARLALDDVSSAAIASRVSADLMGIEVIQEGIQDQEQNSTRFIVLSNADAPRKARDKTSVMLLLREKGGALTRVLKAFEKAKITVTRLESRPSHLKTWQYHYFLDFAGHRTQPEIQRVLKSVAKECERVKVLGSYSAHSEAETPELERANALLKRAERG